MQLTEVEEYCLRETIKQVKDEELTDGELSIMDYTEPTMTEELLPNRLFLLISIGCSLRLIKKESMVRFLTNDEQL